MVLLSLLVIGLWGVVWGMGKSITQRGAGTRMKRNENSGQPGNRPPGMGGKIYLTDLVKFVIVK